MEKEKKNGSVIIIILLVTIILILGSYIVYDKVLSNNEKDGSVIDEKNEEKSKKAEEENLDVNGDLVVGLIGKITNAMGCTNLKDTYLTDGVFKASDFSNQDIYSLALRSIYSEVEGDPATGTGFKDFSADTLEKAIAKIVGINYKFTNNSYISCPAWDYDINSKTYKAPESTGCGCTTGPYHTIAKSIRALKIGKKIEIYQRVIFVDTLTGKGYSDSKKTKEIAGLVTNPTDEWGNSVNDIDENNENNINKGTLYKLVFEENDGEYIFVSSEPTNE